MERFQKDELIQTWVIHYLQLIGEASRKLTPSLKERYLDVPWRQIIGTRPILVHEYFGSDPDEIGSVVERDLPLLKQGIQKILMDMQ